jgi:hypothetical protein
MLGIGDGTFGATTNLETSWQYQVGIAAIDLNGDGKADLIISGGPPTIFGIGVCFSNGDGTFQPPVYYRIGSDKSVSNPIVGDFNGDGIPDVIVAGSSGIWLFTGKGAGVFNPAVLTTSLSGALWLASADFNGDGILDLAVSYYPGGLSVLFGRGAGYFNSPVSVSNAQWGYVVAGVLKAGSRPDIILPGANIYPNNGKGGFGPPYSVSVPGDGTAIGDVNGDGIPDLASSEGYVALGLGNGQFAPAVGYTVANTNGWFSVALAKLTKGVNGEDLIFGLNSTVSVLLNRGNDTFIDGKWIPVSGGNNCGAAGDFNRDGKPDLAVLTGQGLQILLGTGDAASPYTFGEMLSFSGGSCPIAGDVNGDGITDLLEGADSLAGVGVYLGNGDGTFTMKSVIPFGPSADIALGDFNHDGKTDVASSSNQLALGNGDGTFQAPGTLIANPPPNGFYWIAVGDVNNDGWADVLAACGDGCPYTYLYLNNHLGGFTQSSVTQSYPSAVMLTDLTGDGNLDAVVTSSAAYVTILIGDGKGGFTGTQNHVPYPFVDQLPAQVGDVNGDGIPDLLLPADGSIGIALGNGKGEFQAPFVEGVGPGVGQVFTQALHGQPTGLADIVAPDYTGGITVLFNTTKR